MYGWMDLPMIDFAKGDNSSRWRHLRRRMQQRISLILLSVFAYSFHLHSYHQICYWTRYILLLWISLSLPIALFTLFYCTNLKKKEGNLEKEAVEMEKKQPSQWLLGKSPTWCELNKLEDRQTDRCCSSDSSSDKRKRPTYLSLSLNYYPFWTFLYSGHISRLLDSNPRLES